MEINTPRKSGSFSFSIGHNMQSPRTPTTPPSPFINAKSDSNQDAMWQITPDCNINEVSEEIDRFTDALTTIDHESNPPQVPDNVETLAKIIESRISKYNSSQTTTSKFGRTIEEEDSFFMEAIRCLSKLVNSLSEFPGSSTNFSSSLNRTSTVLQRAMTFLETQFRVLLKDSRSSSMKSLGTTHEDSDRCVLREPESNKEHDDLGYSPESVTKMNRIATAMISAGYVTECGQVYSITRRNVFQETMKNLILEKINIEDVQRTNWESIEVEIRRWINAVKHCSDVLFPSERKLGELVFSEYPSTYKSIFSGIARVLVTQFLDFAEAVAMTKRSTEKLFKFLDMYETLSNFGTIIHSYCPDDDQHELKAEISATSNRIGEAAVNVFCDLENSIKGDIARAPVPGGAVHPLTRYVLNYLKYACEYKETLECIFKRHAKHLDKLNLEKETESPRGDDQMMENATPFSIQLMSVMDLLDSNLEAKSTLYRDLSLRYIFLMNNGRYILQKVKGSTEIHHVMSDTWIRRRSTVVRQFHKNYQRETWGKVLKCLGPEGLQMNGKVHKPAVKERFKTFNMMFDEIHKTQSTWIVSDEQLLPELRVSISALVIPAYRSFLGRFRQYIESGRSADKYIKYQPEDIETIIMGLFDGNVTSMNRRKA